MKNNVYIIVLMCLALSNCGIYTSYNRTDTPLTDSLYRDATSGKDTSSLASLEWEELFTDPLLQNLIRTGLEQNTDLAKARLKVEEAQASLQTSRLQFLPSLSLYPDGQINSNLDTKTTSKTYSLGASASWEIDAFGKQRNAKEKAKATLAEKDAYRQAVQTQLLASIAENYYSLLMLDRKLAITKETLVTWSENVKTMKALKRAGQYTEAAVAQAEASRLNAESSVFSLEHQIYGLENTMSALLGIAPQKIDRSGFADINFPEKLSYGVPLQMVSNRPDVRQAEYALANAFYNTNYARSSFYPSITLSGTLGWTNSTGATITNPGQWVANVVGSLVQPVFNKGQNIANLKIAKAQQEEASLAYSQSLLDAGVDVNNALSQWQTARKKLQNDSLQIDALQTAVTSTRLLMRHGTTNYLEVLTAQQSLLSAQLSEVSDKYDEVQSVILLYHALGGGKE